MNRSDEANNSSVNTLELEKLLNSMERSKIIDPDKKDL
jgi:hypothetical protein